MPRIERQTIRQATSRSDRTAGTGERRVYERPMLRITGQTLTDAGMAIGDEVTVTAAPGVLVVTALPSGQSASPIAPRRRRSTRG